MKISLRSKTGGMVGVLGKMNENGTIWLFNIAMENPL